mgnify:CR=1 FL=1|tara:strand:+ start:429 stop:632 length:204 start_codon:yes stop_codon:yes gene_type:complete
MYENSDHELLPGVYVISEKNRDWGIGQIQSSINDKITINFEHVGKKVIYYKKIKLRILKNNEINRSI